MDLPLKPSRRIDCGCISRKVSSLYVCTKVVFFDVRKIALFTYFITQVEMISERTVVCLKLCAWRTDLPCKDPNGDFVFRGPLMLRDTVQICGVHQ